MPTRADLPDLLAPIDDAVVVLDRSGRVVHASDGFCALLGFSADQVVGDDPPLFTRSGASRGGVSLDDDAMHLLTAHGPVPVDVRVTPLMLDGGRVDVYAVRKVPMNPRTGHAEKLSAGHLRSLLGHLPGGVYRCTFRRTWRTVFVSPRCGELLGIPLNRLVGRSGVDFRELMVEEDIPLVRATVGRAIARKQPYELEYRIRRGDGTIRWIHDRGVGVSDRRGRVRWLDGVMFDITARKKAESTLAQYAADLDQSRKVAEDAARTKSEFLATMSHEIRTPLNAIIGMTGLLLERPLDAREQDYVETIRLSGDALLGIINDILDFSKIDAGRIDLEAVPFDVRVCVEEALDLLAPRAAEKRLELLYRLDDDVPARVEGDVTRLRQILVNLLSNAVKFTQTGEVDISVSAEGGTGERVRLRFQVRDTGIGIPLDERESLFEAFRQVDASTTRRFGGTGLGLAISRRLAQLMHGDMWVDSVVDEGSTFGFDVELGRLPQPAVRNPANLAARRALVITEHPLAGERLAERLRTWGMFAVSSTWSPVLFEHLDGQPPDVLLIEGVMGDVDGDRIISAIRQRLGERAPLMVRMDPLRRRPERAGAPDRQGPDAELTRPIRDDALRRTLARLFGAESVLPTPIPISATIPAMRLLVAEDNPINQKVVVRQLETLGLEAHVVADGREALDALSHAHYDVVLMDVQMPEMDGLEATRRLRRMLPPDDQPYVIALTANATREDEVICIAAGMDAYLAKPLRRTKLAEALRAGARRMARDKVDPSLITR